MKEVQAFEHNGILYKTKKEALESELYDELYRLLYQREGSDVIRILTKNKSIQKEVLKLITKHQQDLTELI